jgi:hypothetical protein
MQITSVMRKCATALPDKAPKRPDRAAMEKGHGQHRTQRHAHECRQQQERAGGPALPDSSSIQLRAPSIPLQTTTRPKIAAVAAHR